MLACGHLAPESFGVCTHARAGGDYVERFTGRGFERELVCTACAAPGSALERICRACRDRLRAAMVSDGHLGEPAIIDEPSAVRFEHLPELAFPVAAFLDVRPRPGGDRDRWLAVTTRRELLELDLDRGEVAVLARVPELTTVGGTGDHADDRPPLTLHVSRDGTLAAIVQEDHGLNGVVIDLASGAHLMSLVRDEYCAENCVHSVAFVEHAGRTLLVHASAWNRLDVHDPRTGALLTPRGPTSYARGEETPPHYLDYFHCGLAVSPDQTWIVDNGWVWQPDGVVTTWRIAPWLTDNPWESEDGPSRKILCWRSEWDQPMCWLDDTRLALWGYGEDGPLLAAVRIFDVARGVEVDAFAGPRGELVFDRVLISLAKTGAAVWDVTRGTRLLADDGPSPTRFHPTAKTFLRFEDSSIYRSRLLGLDASYRTGAIAELADRIAREHAFEDLPVLGDALEAAGCTDREMLAHCQHPGDHAERCWVLERLR